MAEPTEPPLPTRRVGEERYYISDSQVLDSLYINLIWGGLCVAAFVALRAWTRGAPGVWQRRQELQDLFMRPPRLILGRINQVWNWVAPLLAVSDADIVRTGGFDALVLTRTLLIGLQLFTFMSIFGIAVLIPAYYNLGDTRRAAALGSLSRASLSALAPGSRLLWLPFAFTYLFIGYSCFVLWINCKCYAQLRTAYFLCLDVLPPHGSGSAVDAAATDLATPEAQKTATPTATATTTSAAATGAGTTTTSSGLAAAPSSTPAGVSGCGAGSHVPGGLMDGGTWQTSSGPMPVTEGKEDVEGNGAAVPKLPIGRHQEAAGIEGADRPMGCPEQETMSRPRRSPPASAFGAPEMGTSSKLFNVMNFFNPALRMLLDYLDWMDPRQTAAAQLGVRSLWLPRPFSDEAPDYVKQYSRREPLLLYDDEVTGLVRQAWAGGQPGAGWAHASGKEAAGVGGAEGVHQAAGGRDGGGAFGGWEAVAPPVMPYWRRVLASRRRGTAGSASAEAQAYWTGAGTAAERATHLLQLGAQQEQEVEMYGSDSTQAGGSNGDHAFKGLRKRGGHALDRASGGSGSSSGGGSGSSGSGSGGAGRYDGMYPSWYREADVWDPSQPLLAGKNNSRLLQLLRVPMHPASTQPAQAAPAAPSPHHSQVPAGAPSAPSPAASPAEISLPPLQRILRPHPGTNGNPSATSAAPASRFPHSTPNTTTSSVQQRSQPPERTRLVNAHHYAVLIKRVHVQRGPSWEDRMAAVTYLVVQGLRSGAAGACSGLYGLVRKGTAQAEEAERMTITLLQEGPSTGGGLNAGALSVGTLGGGLADAWAAGAGEAGAGMTVQPPNDAVPELSYRFNEETRRYRLMQKVGGNRAMRDVARYYSLFYDRPELSHRGAPDCTAAGAAAAAVGHVSSPRQVAAAAGVHEQEQQDHPLQLQQQERVVGGEEPVTAPEHVQLAVWTAAEEGRAQQEGERDGQGQRGGHRVPGAAVEGVEGGKEPLGAAGGGSWVGVAAMDVEECKGVKPVQKQQEEEGHEKGGVDRNAEAVRRVLTTLYPHTFVELVPVVKDQAVFALLWQWDLTTAQLLAAVREQHQLQARRLADAEGGQAAHGCCGGGGGGGAGLTAAAAAEQRLSERVAALAAEVAGLEARVEAERRRALKQPLGTAYFALFSSARDAQALAQCSRVLQPQGPGQLLTFDAEPAPPPDDVSWPSLWSTGTWQQAARELGARLPLLITFCIPMGPIQGALSNLTLALCGTAGGQANATQNNKLYSEFWCSYETNYGVRILVSIVTGILPSVLGLVWTSIAMPHLLYLCSSIRRRQTSLSGMDREMQTWFWWYSFINTFLGAVLGGGVLGQLGTYLRDPTKLFAKIGATLPQTANFFIQYCTARAVFNNFLRLAWPHAGSMLTGLFRSLTCLCRPRSVRDATLIHMVPSGRIPSWYNGILQVFMFGFAFAVVSPVILPVAWCFFLTAFVTYRYALLYVFERSYESGGRMWPVLVDQIVGFMLIHTWFTAAVLLTNANYVGSGVMAFTITPPLVMFWRHLKRAYCQPVDHPPLALMAHEPPAHVSPLVYLPPPLRPGAVGWYPQQGRVWEKYGIPRHYF